MADPWKRVEVIGDATLYLGDCLTILPVLPKVDAVITDPQYGIGLDYQNGMTDDAQHVTMVAVKATQLCFGKADLVSITPGNINHYLYPKPTWTLCWFNRAGNGSGPWGFSCWQPILCYGSDPYLATGKGRRGDYIEHSEISEINGHPCPKPERFMQKWIDRVAFNAEIIADPFMGSGTTGVACMNLGRKFIGVEIEERYFNIACERIENAQRQKRMFP